MAKESMKAREVKRAKLVAKYSERRDTAVAMNIYGEQDMKIFESGVQYFK